MYRLYTENKNQGQVEKIVASKFDGFTILHALGYWKGQAEDSLIIEIETENEKAVHEVAESIRQVNHQMAVMVQKLEDSVEMVYG